MANTSVNRLDSLKFPILYLLVTSIDTDINSKVLVPTKEYMAESVLLWDNLWKNDNPSICMY